jgi:hypothetical protein
MPRGAAALAEQQAREAIPGTPGAPALPEVIRVDHSLEETRDHTMLYTTSGDYIIKTAIDHSVLAQATDPDALLGDAYSRNTRAVLQAQGTTPYILGTTPTIRYGAAPAADTTPLTVHDLATSLRTFATNVGTNLTNAQTVFVNLANAYRTTAVSMEAFGRQLQNTWTAYYAAANTNVTAGTVNTWEYRPDHFADVTEGYNTAAYNWTYGAAPAPTAKERRYREVAKRKAARLLNMYLTKEQRGTLEAYGWFEVVAPSGTRYRIKRGKSQNIYELSADNKAVRRLCAHPAQDAPDEDHMLIQKLALETDEQGFRKIANITHLSEYNDQPAWMPVAA